MLRVKDVMSAPVISISPDILVKDASALLAEKNVSGLPVVDGDRLVGIFTEADVLRSMRTMKKDLRLVYPSISSLGIAFQEEVTQREIIEAYNEIGKMSVKQVMSQNVVSVAPDAALNDAIVSMVRKGINRLPVVEKNRLVGIITRGDVIRGLAKEGANHRDQDSEPTARLPSQ